ncbi:MAG: hypothetical protein ABF992_05770 [Lentilactobacillus hilgardii]
MIIHEKASTGLHSDTRNREFGYLGMRLADWLVFFDFMVGFG